MPSGACAKEFKVPHCPTAGGRLGDNAFWLRAVVFQFVMQSAISAAARRKCQDLAAHTRVSASTVENKNAGLGIPVRHDLNRDFISRTAPGRPICTACKAC